MDRPGDCPGWRVQIAKADLLILSGKAPEGKRIRTAAIEGSEENELNNYGYQLMNEGKVKEALAVLRTNVERHPDSWNVYDSLGEGYANDRQPEMAARYYKLALEKEPPENQIQRINQTLDRLQSQ